MLKLTIFLALICNLSNLVLANNDEFKNLTRPVFDSKFGRVWIQNVKYDVCVNYAKYGFVNRAGTQKYYLIAESLMTWKEGQFYCQQFGANLPSVHSLSDNNYLRCNF